MKDKYFILIIYGIAIVAGSFFIIFNPHTYGPWGFDGYDALAWNIVNGNGYSFNLLPPYDLTAFRLPGYPLIAAVIYKIFGHNYLPVHIFQVFLNGFICVMIFYIVKEIYTKKVAYFSSFIVALCGISNVYVSTVVTEVVAVFLFALHTLLFVLGYRHNSAKYYMLSGAVLGYAMLVRPSFALMSIFFVLGLIIIVKSQRIYLNIFLYFVSIGIIFSPWIIRNYRLVNEPVILGTQGGSQLLYGSLETGKYSEMRFANPWAHYETLNAYAYNSETDIVFDAQLKKQVDSVYVAYNINNDGFLKKEMTHAGGNRYRCKIPPPAYGSIIRYYIEANASSLSDGVSRFPYYAPHTTLHYYINKNIFNNLDKGDEFIDVYDFVEAVRLIVGTKEITQNALLKYDLNNDNGIDRSDLEIISWSIVHNSDKNLFNYDNQILDLTKKQEGIEITFIDNSKMYIPDYFDNNTEKINMFAEKGIAFSILNGSVDRSALVGGNKNKINHDNIFISAGTDIYGIKSELNRQYLQRKLALFNIKRDFRDYFVTSFKRSIRMWITTGSSDISISHPPPGGKYLYFALAKFISIAMLINGLLGIFFVRNNLRELIFLLIPIIYFPLTHSFMMANARHTLPANPFLLVFNAISIITIYDFVKNKLFPLTHPSPIRGEDKGEGW